MCDLLILGEDGSPVRYVCGHSLSPNMSRMEERTLDELCPTWRVGDPPRTDGRRPRIVYLSA